ncbi:hypothetical protein OL358_14970 [Microbacterium sp. SSM24]|nr:hypothetical protein [Microbacterium sp. SSM24]MCW3494664.1 hypothetical protein [Microbacterium sp. SSM24]
MTRRLTEQVTVVGRHHLDLIHAVEQRLAGDVDHERIADPKSVEVGEQGGFGDARVTGQHGVSAVTADREAGPVQVPDPASQRALLGAVVDGEVHADGRDPNARHGRIGRQGQSAQVRLAPFLDGDRPTLFVEDVRVTERAVRQIPVVLARAVEQGLPFG